MNEAVKMAFGPIAAPKGGTLVIFVGADLKPGERAGALLGDFAPRIESAAKTAGFQGKALTALDILEPFGLEAARLLVLRCSQYWSQRITGRALRPPSLACPVDFESARNRAHSHPHRDSRQTSCRKLKPHRAYAIQRS